MKPISTMLCGAWLLACHPANRSAPHLPAAATPLAVAVVAAEPHLEVRVDPRVELFSILFRAANNPSYRVPARDTAYERAVRAKIDELQDHRAVVSTRRLFEEHEIGYSAPIGLAVYLQWPSLKPRRSWAPRPPGLDERWEGVDIPAYLKEVRAFVEDGEFETFFDAQKLYWGEVQASLDDFVEPFALAPWFHAFFGDAQTQHILVQGLLTGPHNYGANVELRSGDKEAYQVVLVWDPDEQGVPRPAESLLAYIAHEMAHAHVNPRTTDASSILQPSAEALFLRVAPQMERLAYGHWKIMVDESLVRAVTRVYLSERGATAALAEAAEQDDAQGFLWVTDLVDVLEQQRAAAGTQWHYADVLPRAIDVFSHWADDEEAIKRVNRFCGPINAVFERVPKIVGPHPHTARPLAKYVASIGEQFDMEVTTATEINLDDGDQSYVLYGSPKSNPAVSQWLGNLGWRVRHDRIVMGSRQWHGENLVLIAAVRHPKDETHAVLGYVSHDAANLVGINAVPHGPTDWVVAKRTSTGLEALESGSFPNNEQCRYGEP